MAAVVRVKRRRDEDPAESLVFLCKKIKRDSDNDSRSVEYDEKIQSQFKFAGTTTTKDRPVTETVHQAITKEKLEKEYKRHTSNISAFTSRQHKTSVTNARYKIISQKRALNFYDLAKDDASYDELQTTAGQASGSQQTKLFCLYDVEKVNISEIPATENKMLSNISEDVVTCNDVPMTRERLTPLGEDKYVYDLYYMNNSSFDFRALENILAIEAYIEDTEYLPELEIEDDVLEDEDDENDENNWRNDYPEQDPYFYENDDEDDRDDIQLGFDEENDYSSTALEDVFRRQLKFSKDVIESNICDEDLASNDKSEVKRLHEIYKRLSDDRS